MSNAVKLPRKIITTHEQSAICNTVIRRNFRERLKTIRVSVLYFSRSSIPKRMQNHHANHFNSKICLFLQTFQSKSLCDFQVEKDLYLKHVNVEFCALCSGILSCSHFGNTSAKKIFTQLA